MVQLFNLSYGEYIRKYDDYKIICIGAGGTFNNFINCHQEKLFLLNKIETILDNNKELEGTERQVLANNIQIGYLPSFSKDISGEKWIIFILVADAYVIEVANQLDKMQIFDGIDCIYGAGTFKWGYTFFPVPKHRIFNIHKVEGKERIPRVIHYCWFGEKPIPEKDKKCIESFSKYNPDYKIIKWSEDNFDLEHVPLYVKQAYENKKYAFVSDYVRLAVVYKYGGIYFDTDVEIFQSIDFLLKYRMMFAYMEYGELATGLGFASVSNAPELKELLEMYETIPFVMKDGSFNMTPCPRYTNEYFRRRGMYLDNSLEIKDDILFLSSDFLCPMSPIECSDGSYQLAQLSLSDYTIGIHWCNNTWKNIEDLDIFDEVKKERADINNRLLKDWKRKRGIE